MVHQRVWRREKKEWEWEPGAMYDEWIRGHCYKEKTRGQRSAEEQPQHHIPQRISSQGIASWCSSNIPNEERRRKRKWVWGHYSSLFLSVGPTAAPWQVEEGTLFSFERGRACQVIKKKKKTAVKITSRTGSDAGHMALSLTRTNGTSSQLPALWGSVLLLPFFFFIICFIYSHPPSL